MNISEKWLREWANPAGDLSTLLESLTMAGLEVESCVPVADKLDKVVVAEVIDLQPHPNADRLRVCKVNTGTEILQIVCGAKNVEKGQKVPAALIGAHLGADLVIKASQLRGVDSFGMLCAAAELGIDDGSDGLLVLPQDAPVGMAINEYLQLDDHIIEISLTPNRGDCLSVAGLAREVSALMATPLTPPLFDAVKPTIDAIFPVKVEESASCPNYVGRIVKGITHQPSPLWLKEKLRRAGVRSIHPVVDVTNYVMLELGQPMHAFDLAKLQGSLTVRLAKSNEALTLLDGKQVNLETATLIIADEAKALAIAGVMGGAETAVNDGTVDIFLESAFFTPAIVANKARAYGLSTDSAHRFERGVDPILAERALERATGLLLSIVGGQAGPVIITHSKEHQPIKKTVNLRLNRINSVLGTAITATWVEQQFPLLGFELKAGAEPDTWMVTVPSYRFDIAIEADLVEEAARLYGYNQIAYTMPVASLEARPRSETSLSLRQIKQLLAARAYSEAITYSFVEPKMQALFDPEQKPYALANPISPELAVMRTSLWQSLMTVYLQNLARQSVRVRLFEQGLCFRPTESNKLEQISMLAGLCAGNLYAEQWDLPNRGVDFFDVKKDLEALLALRHDTQAIEFIPAAIPALHPGRSAAIMVAQQVIGYVGELHPQIMDSLDLRQPVYLFELYLDQFITAQLPRFATLSKYPSVRRDIAVVVEQSIPVEAFKKTFSEICGELLVDWQLFDVYQGINITEGHRSLAFSLTLQHVARTLTDIEVADCMDRLIAALRERFGALLRE